MGLLDGRKALIFGVANDHSIAWGIARAFHEAGATVGFSSVECLIERRVRPLAESIGATFVEPCDIQSDEQINAVMDKWHAAHGEIDILVHAVAYAKREDLDGLFVDTSRDGFATALDVSAYSLVAPVRYLAADLGPDGIRINAISAGPIRTLSAGGISGFRKLYGPFNEIAPLRSHITIEDVGKSALYLASDLSSAVTGEVVFVDGGFNIMGVPTPDE